MNSDKCLIGLTTSLMPLDQNDSRRMINIGVTKFFYKLGPIRKLKY